VVLVEVEMTMRKTELARLPRAAKNYADEHDLDSCMWLVVRNSFLAGARWRKCRDTRKAARKGKKVTRARLEAYKASLDAVAAVLFPHADQTTRDAEMDFGAGGAVASIRSLKDRLERAEAAATQFARVLVCGVPCGVNIDAAARAWLKEHENGAVA
jgi:hypothetical protein